MSLARDTIGYEWRRYVAAISIIALTGLIFYLLLGMLLNQWRSFSAFERELNADIIVNSEVATARYRPITQLRPENFYLHPEIVSAQPYLRFGLIERTRLESGEFTLLRAVVVDTADGAMSFPKSLPDRSRSLLRNTGNILVSERLLAQMELGTGDFINISDRPNRIVGAFTAPFDNRANIIMSIQTYRLYRGISQDTNPSLILLEINNLADLDQTIAELNSWIAQYGLIALRPAEFSRSMSLTALRDTPNFLVIFYIVILVVIVAILIAAQALRSAILAMRSQFATMKALGIPGWRVSLFTMEIAFWTGILGAVTAISSALLCQAILLKFNLTILITGQLVVLISGALMAMALLAGLLCLSIVLRVKPVELLR